MLNSKKTSLLVLALTALVCSRGMFALFNDPEGPNLLIVVVMAAILFALSWTMYSFGSSSKGPKRLLVAVLLQVVVAAGLYFVLN